MFLTRQELQDKINGCWYGKNVGGVGTLGMSFEWKRQVNNVDFYVQDLMDKSVLNDDLRDNFFMKHAKATMDNVKLYIEDILENRGIYLFFGDLTSESKSAYRGISLMESL